MENDVVHFTNTSTPEITIVTPPNRKRAKRPWRHSSLTSAGKQRACLRHGWRRVNEIRAIQRQLALIGTNIVILVINAAMIIHIGPLVRESADKIPVSKAMFCFDSEIPGVTAGDHTSLLRMSLHCSTKAMSKIGFIIHVIC